MLLRVKLIGKGTDKKPYGVNLPTWNLVHGNITHGYAIVTVPDHVHGLTEEDLAGEEYEETTEGRLYHALSEPTLRKLHDHLDDKYQEHRGQFRVEQSR